MIRLILLVSFLTNMIFAQESNSRSYTITETQRQGEVINIEINSYKILEFSKRITDITLNSSKSVSINYLTKNTKIPFSKIKVFAKEKGKSYALVTFEDKSITQINFNVVSDIKDLEAVIRSVGPGVTLTKINENVVLKGEVKNNKDKAKIIDIVKNYQSDIKIVDLIKTKEPNLMVRMKLYIAEINNDDGLEIKNNWFVSSKNYMEVTDTSGLYQNYPLDPTLDQSWNDVNNQRNSLVNTAIDNLMANAVSLTGGLTGAANYLGKYFNVGYTLNFLQTEGIARVLDESELLTLEGKESVFHAGGKVYVKTTGSTADGIPVTQLKSIDYGLKLKVTVNEIINNEYVDLTITTNQDKIDWANQVDGIPNFIMQSIDTYVIAKDKNTIVLGGLVSKEDSKNYEKVPFLGDIPILGELFKSRDFQNGKSELVFFIVPEIVDPVTNSNEDRMKDKIEFFDSEEFKKSIAIEEELKKEQEEAKEKKN